MIVLYDEATEFAQPEYIVELLPQIERYRFSLNSSREDQFVINRASLKK